MFQSLLFFILGFLAAAFLALLAAPAIWRRAVVLTRRRIEASTPLSMNEIQADKDRLRAEYAMSIRRLEMSLQSLREKSAEQAVETSRDREELKRLSGSLDEANKKLGETETQAIALRSELHKREDEIGQQAARLTEKNKKLEERQRDLEDLGRLYNEASMNASNSQIDLVARETEVDKLTGDVSMLRAQRRDDEKRLRTTATELRSANEALKAEKKRAAELEKKLERAMAALPDREEKLQRREKELARLREQVKLLTGSENELAEQLTIQQTERLKLEAELADLQQMRGAPEGARNGDAEGRFARLAGERATLEERLTLLTRENKKLRETIADLGRRKADEAGGERRESAALRERINDLAAEVVNLTMKLEGPDSPIGAALKAGVKVGNGQAPGPAGAAPSIADRVRALQKAASKP